MKKPLVSLIVPCWNEQEVIDLFYQETLDAIAKIDAIFEFLFIDDGSTDATYQHLQSIADADERVKIIRFSKNFGSFPAITAGMHYCTGDVVVCMAADLQDPPSLIGQMLDSWKQGNDIIWAAIDGRGDSPLQSFLSRSFYSIIRRTGLKELPPQGMNVGMFSRRVINVFNALPERDSLPFFTILKLGFKQAQIPYYRKARRAGSSGWSFWKRVRTAVDVIVTFSYAPVRMISAVGFFAAFFGLIYAVVIVFQKVFFGLDVSGWSSLMVVLLVVSGIQMVTLGFIAEYLWRQSRQVRREPRYIIMETHGQIAVDAPVNPVVDLENIDVAVRPGKPENKSKKQPKKAGS